MANVATILKAKGCAVYSVPAEKTVFEAVRRMVEHNVGSLVVVTDRGRLSGIITERDYLRHIVLEGRSSRTTLVEAIMSRDVLQVSPETSVDQCMRIMTDWHVRHLPVADGDVLLGIVSIGDVVKMQTLEHRSSMEQMTQYIQGRA